MPPDNPPAFPVATEGMTLREYYAGQALIAVYSRQLQGFFAGDLVHVAWDVADMMMAERNRRK